MTVIIVKRVCVLDAGRRRDREENTGEEWMVTGARRKRGKQSAGRELGTQAQRPDATVTPRAESRRGQRKPEPLAPPPSASVPPTEPSGAREQMIRGAARLLAQRGLQATSFSEVIALTGAPRGSLYHHFPGGKDQLVQAALDRVTGQMEAVLAPIAGAPADQVTAAFLQAWRTVLTRSHFRAGCAVVAVTVATESSDLLAHVGSIFRSWRAKLAALLRSGGLHENDALHFATLLISASEGAVVLSRAEQSLEPFELVADDMLKHARALMRRSKG